MLENETLWKLKITVYIISLLVKPFIHGCLTVFSQVSTAIREQFQHWNVHVEIVEKRVFTKALHSLNSMVKMVFYGFLNGY